MQTSGFDEIIGKTENENVLNRRRWVAKSMLFMCLSPFVGCGIIYAGERDNMAGLFLHAMNMSTSLFVISLFIIDRLFGDDVKKKAQIDRLLKIFKDEIATKYKPTDIENASMMGELVLGYMSDEEKGKIKKLCAETDFSDYASAKSFIEQIKQIVKPVFTRNPGLDKLLKDIANGQTYMFPGWQYNQSGHGGR